MPHCINAKVLKTLKSFVSIGGVAELINEFVVYLRDWSSNLGTDRKYFNILFVLHLNPNLYGVNS
jgi:hypothetical protein